MAYEWRRQKAGDAARAEPERAEAVEIERLADRYEDKLAQAGFFFPPEKAPGMKQTLRAMFSRLALTSGDVRILHGVLRQLTRGAPAGAAGRDIDDVDRGPGGA